LEWAIRVAADAHKQQVRKATQTPYIIHPFSVMLLAQQTTNDEDTLIACLFHDILEDVSEYYSETQMQKDFGDRVVEIVKGVTKDDSLSDWKERSDAYLAHLEHEALNESIIVSIADKTHNLLSTLNDHELLGDGVWSKFNAGKDSQLWWYQSVADIADKRMPELSLIPLLREHIQRLEEIVRQPVT
jgi:(p)ppGpp synthase/HD superfamily hydrolase